MNRVRRLLKLRLTDQALLIKALFLVGFVRLGLWCLPFKTMLGLIERASAGGHGGSDYGQVRARRLVWAVTAVSRYIPAASCLTQALAAQVLLERSGLHTELRIGVVKNSLGLLEAHAWLEDHTGILLGYLPNMAQFIQLPTLKVARS